jgi:hypothetical protein
VREQLPTRKVAGTDPEGVCTRVLIATSESDGVS